MNCRFSEYRKKPIDTPQIAFIQLRLIREYLDLLTWSEGRVNTNSKNYADLTGNKTGIDSDMLKSFNSGNYRRVNNVFYYIDSIFKSDYMHWDNLFAAEYQSVSRKENWWNNIFYISLYFG